jgi:mycofactocin precursor
MAGMSAPETTQITPVEAAVPAPGDGELVEDDLLVEEISIDGMCGVY